MPSQPRIDEQLIRLIDRFTKVRPVIGMSQVGHRQRDVDTARITQLIGEIDERIDGLFDAVNVAPLRATSENVLAHRVQQAAGPQQHLGTAARIKSLATALPAIARERVAWIAQLDALQAAVVEHALEGEREFWQQPASEARIYALILNEPELAAELRSRSILCWGVGGDRRVRIVNADWLQSHADRYSYVSGRAPPGLCCRFCRLPEIEDAELIVHEAPPRPKIGRGSIQQTRVRLHRQCLPFWQKWVAECDAFDSLEAAVVADVAAGRTPLGIPPPASETDPPANPPTGGVKRSLAAPPTLFTKSAPDNDDANRRTRRGATT